MGNLLWPGDRRAGRIFSDAALLHNMVTVEEAWLEALVAADIAPAGAAVDLHAVADADTLMLVSDGSESGGNPVIPLVRLIRARLESSQPSAALWVHRGLTSQDVVDTALMLSARAAMDVVSESLRRQAKALMAMVAEHRRTPMVARTLTTHAVPTTFGLVAAGWLTSVVEAYKEVAALEFFAQFGGAAGTMAALRELTAHVSDGPGATRAVVEHAAALLELSDEVPWHTSRHHVTRLGDGAVRCTDAWGRLARDVLVLSRPEIGELAVRESGGSSTMPHKQNPTLAVLIRRTAITAPMLGATLHACAADQVDQRADGAWHAEWETLRTLLRRTVVAGLQVCDLLDVLEVRAEKMELTLEGSQAWSEQEAMSALTGSDPAPEYFGVADSLIDEALLRARAACGDPQ